MLPDFLNKNQHWRVVNNYLLHMGFYNFSYSLPMFFFVVGYWLKYQNRFTLRNTVTLSLLSLLLYFCHLTSSPLCAELAREWGCPLASRLGLPLSTTRFTWRSCLTHALIDVSRGVDSCMPYSTQSNSQNIECSVMVTV